MKKKEKIIILFFENKLTTVEIASKLKVTKQYVSRIVRNDSRYTKEREDRKSKSKQKQTKRVKDYIYKKRQKEKQERLNAMVEMQHIQASMELSGRNTINNRAYRNWNSSIYEYYNKTKEYRVKKDYQDKVSYAVPKKIKWK
ncbi:MAG: hypothetical protein ACLUVE_02275 [Clostridia bacterium]|jgi:transcriptional regulator with XRE-family HTH domain